MCIALPNCRAVFATVLSKERLFSVVADNFQNSRHKRELENSDMIALKINGPHQ